MTLAIAAEGVGELAGAGAGTAAGAGRAAGSRSVTERTGVAPTRPRAASGIRPSSPPAAARTGQGSTSSSASRSKGGGGRLSFPKISTGKGTGATAHRVVIAEFVACLVLIGVMPILVRPPASDSGGNPHVYVANDLLRLSATCLLFFILALLSNQPRSARFAAAFGGLVTLGAAFNANQAFVALAALLTPKPTPAAAS